MPTTPTIETHATTRHPALRVMWAGLAVTVLAGAAPLLDLVTTGTIEAHVRETYPSWSDDWVRGDTTGLAVGLAIIGLLGVVGWLVSIQATRRAWRWARGLTTGLWLVAVAVALFVALAPAEPYERLAPAGIAALTALPCVAGFVAVVQLWRHRP